MFRVSATGQVRESLSELSAGQFFDPTRAALDQEIERRSLERKRTQLMPDPIDLLVLNALHGQRDLHCSEIVRRIYEITLGSVTVSHKAVWHSLRRLRKSEWVEYGNRDSDAGRRKSRLYRLRDGGGSHVGLQNKHWKEVSAGIHAAISR